MNFELWLEFEAVDSSNWNIENDFCNIRVDLPNGKHYGLNIWTYKFLEAAVNLDRRSGNNLGGLYQKPPDLFVKELSRNCIEMTIMDLLSQGNLEDILNTSILFQEE